MNELQTRLERLSPAKRAILERRVLAGGKRPTASITRRGAEAPPVLSFAERRLWFLDQLEPQSAFYNMPIAARLLGPLDRRALSESLRTVVARHETLRTTYPALDGQPFRRVTANADVPIEWVDLSTEPQQERAAALSGGLKVRACRPFDLGAGPLLRVTVFRLDRQEHVVLLAMHHIVSDGWSMAVMLRELAVAYDAARQGKPCLLPEPEIEYADFAVWQQQQWEDGCWQAEFAYWQSRLGDDPPPLDLPCDHPRPAAASFIGATRAWEIPGELADGIRRLCRGEGVTLFMTLLAAYNVLLARWTRQDDFSVGTVVAHRNRRELESLIGFFANTLVLRTDLGGEPTFRQLLARVREVALAAYANQNLPFEKLVELLSPERHRSHAPLFQVALVVQNAPLELVLGGSVTIEPWPIDNGTAKYDLTFFATEDRGPIKGHVEYRTELFEPTTIDRMVAAFKLLLAGAVADPDQSIASLPLIEQVERLRVVEQWNATSGPVAQVASLVDCFEQHAERAPQRAAARYRDREITYGQLRQTAARLTAELQRCGVQEEIPVCTFLERSPELMAACLAIWRAGGTYVPVDPGQPPERVAHVIADTAAPLVITRRGLAARLATASCRHLLVEDFACGGDMAEDGSSAQPRSRRADARAYIIYTSGSTGRPKGVEVLHRGIVNFVAAQSELLGITREDRILNVLSPSFDGSLAETWLALANGACLVIADSETAVAADALQTLLAVEQVTLATVPPSVLELLDPRSLTALRTVVSAGEALSGELVARWAPGRRFFNGYGPTEASVGTCMIELGAAPYHRPPIGRPMRNMRVYVLDERLQPVPVGVPGEIVIGGMGVARGYLNQPELTAEKFVRDHLGPEAGGQLYRSGDLGRWRCDGTLEFIGRVDDQVKIRGYRIEPGEVAAVLRECPGVAQAAVVARRDAGRMPRLVGYVVATDEPNVEAGEGGSLEAQHVGGWQALFDELHRSTLAPADPTFNIAGWVSSYNDRPIPAEEMRCWVDGTVERISALAGRRVLEVGCGTGLLLFPLARQCEAYVGTDFNPASLARLREVVAQQGLSSVVTLVECAADQMGAVGQQLFDVIVVNSVVQYFPSIDYLLRMLDDLLDYAAPGGRIFLGDLRTLPLESALAASIELARAGDDVSGDELRRRVALRLEKEEELLVDPMLFDVLPSRWSRLGRVELELKRGPAVNELTAFRYDVVLHLDRAGEIERPSVLDFGSLIAGQSDPLAAVARFIRGGSAPLVVRRVPNRRVAEAVAARQLLEEADAGLTAARLREMTRAASRGAVDPDEVRQLAVALGLDVEIRWSDGGQEGLFDAVFRAVAAGGKPVETARAATAAGRVPAGRCPDWSRYANRPLASAIARRLVPRLYNELSARLPDYMIPSALVVLERLPLSPSGKLDSRALPPPPNDRPQWSGAYVAPRNEHESVVAAVWEELLGVRPVGMTDDFFALGGHSMLAVQVMAEIQRRTGRRLPLAALFQQATVERLARMLSQPEETLVASSLVRLGGQGDGRPLFLVHPAGGTVFCYRSLAERLGQSRPVFGLQAVGIDGHSPPHTSAREMAAHYIATIRSAQPSGPYLLGGWSLGGNLAFEMACQLAEQGEQVGLLALLDAGATSLDRTLSEADFLPLIMALFPGDDHLPLDTLQQMSQGEQLDYFIRRAGQAGLVPQGDLDAARHVFHVFQANVRAMLEYQPRPYAGKVTLLRAAEAAVGLELAHDSQLGWGRWAAAGVDVHVIPGDHVHMIREPEVARVAATIEECLATGRI